jgi:hypothetical protein
MPHERWMKNGSSFAQKWMKIATAYTVIYEEHRELCFFIESAMFWATFC